MSSGRKTTSAKEELWKKRIGEWRKTNLSQAAYCKLNNISISAFSKWKKRLHPKLGAHRIAYQAKSKYYKNSKVSDQKIEALIQCFFLGFSAKVASNRTGINQNTIYKYYNDFRLAFIDGAMTHPQLFSGAGMLLLLGPPHNLEWVKTFIGEHYPAHKCTNSKGEIHSRKKNEKDSLKAVQLKQNIQVISATLVYFCKFKWSMEEVFLYRQLGFQLFYRFVYAPYTKKDPNLWSDELMVELFGKVSNTQVARSNWDYWAMHTSKDNGLIDIRWWLVITKERDFLTPEIQKNWVQRMTADLCWILKQNKIGDPVRIRNTYWDEFFPDNSSVIEEKNKLIEKFQELFPNDPLILTNY